MFELQFFVELLCVTFLGNFLQMIGFDREMLIIFRYLCIGYCFYVLVKSLVILLLYFDDRAGALTLSALFAASSILLSALTLFFGVETYGLGFLGAGNPDVGGGAGEAVPLCEPAGIPGVLQPAPGV